MFMGLVLFAELTAIIPPYSTNQFVLVMKIQFVLGERELNFRYYWPLKGRLIST
jgi:hypothetical protein